MINFCRSDVIFWWLTADSEQQNHSLSSCSLVQNYWRTERDFPLRFNHFRKDLCKGGAASPHLQTLHITKKPSCLNWAIYPPTREPVLYLDLRASFGPHNTRHVPHKDEPMKREPHVAPVTHANAWPTSGTHATRQCRNWDNPGPVVSAIWRSPAHRDSPRFSASLFLCVFLWIFKVFRTRSSIRSTFRFSDTIFDDQPH